MVWSLEVSIPSSMHASMDIDHRDCRTSRMVNTTINDFRDILPPWIHTTVVWKISKPRWFFQKKRSKRTVSPCSVFLVGLITPTSFPTFHARHNSEFNRLSAHCRNHDDLSSKRFIFDRKAFQKQTKKNNTRKSCNTKMLWLTYMFHFVWDWQIKHELLLKKKKKVETNFVRLGTLDFDWKSRNKRLLLIDEKV